MSVLTEQDLDRLEASYKCRQAIVEAAFQDGVPNKIGEIEVINKVLDSMDKSIYDRATIKLKHEENQNREAILDLVTATLTSISKQQISKARDIELSNDLLPRDLVEGETSIHPEQISLKDVVDDDEEDDEEDEEEEE